MPPRKTAPVPSRLAAQTAGVIAKTALALASAVALLFALGFFGGYAGQRVANDARYQIPVSEIRFEAPSYIDKAIFLTEVRMMVGLPETVSCVDTGTQEQLKAAFRKHPWIERVGNITPRPEGGLSAELVFRSPTLAIQCQGEPKLRAVDGKGVLLPESAPTADLPRLVNLVVNTGTVPGEIHRDADVVRASELVGIHPAKSIERVRNGWRITKPDGMILQIASQ